MTTTHLRRELVSLDSAAKYLNVSVKTIRRRIAAGELRAYRMATSRIIRVDLDELDALLKPIPTLRGGDGA